MRKHYNQHLRQRPKNGKRRPRVRKQKRMLASKRSELKQRRGGRNLEGMLMYEKSWNTFYKTLKKKWLRDGRTAKNQC
jgi:hypothetical protein